MGGASMDDLACRWPRLNFVHFIMNGADDVVKYRKWTYAKHGNGRYITMGRPGDTQKVVAGMRSAGIDPEAGAFVLGPELPDMSSTDARAAVTRGDRAAL